MTTRDTRECTCDRPGADPWNCRVHSEVHECRYGVRIYENIKRRFDAAIADGNPWLADIIINDYRPLGPKLAEAREQLAAAEARLAEWETSRS